MVEIRAAIQIKYESERPILIPKDLVKLSKDKQWLQLRPTSQPIIELLTGQRPDKNASLSGSTAMANLIKKRNQSFDQPATPAEQLFDAPEPGSGKKSTRKRSLPDNQEEEVAMDINGSKVTCLMSGKRPRRCDLTIQLEQHQIETIIKTIRNDEDTAQVLGQAKRSYKKKAIHAYPWSQNHATAAQKPEAMAVPPAVVQEVEAIVNGREPVNTRVTKVLQVLEHHGLCQQQTLVPSQVLCHPSNRGGQMVSHFDVWAKGHQLLAVGLQVHLLQGSICLQMSTDPQKRQQQVWRNQQLVQESKGSLAPVSGAEGYLSLASSHTTAFLRCLEHGTTDPSGKAISVPKTDPVWSAIQTGWRWHVVASSVEEAMPSLPQFFQVGANSGNAIGRATSELEAACQIAIQVQMGASLESAIQSVASGEVACRQSLPAIGHYVSRYSGGTSFPLLKFLSHFSSTYGTTCMMGQDFMEALSHTTFPDPGNLYPLLRTALWATQCTSTKQQDGFARLLTRADVQRLSSPQNMESVRTAESMLSDSWKLVQSQLPEGTSTNAGSNHLYKCFGKFCVRAILFLTKKEKLGPDAQQKLESLAQILDLFTQDVSKVKQATPAAEAKTIKDAVSAQPWEATLLQNTHIKVGDQYTLPKEHGAKVYQLLQINNEGGTLEHRPVLQAPETVHVPLAGLGKWRVSRHSMPAIGPADIITRGLPSSHAMAQEDFQKAAVVTALHQCYQEQSVEDLELLCMASSPQALYAKKAIASKKLKLVPLGSISKVKTGQKPPKLAIQAFGHDWAIGSWKQDLQFQAEGTIVPFFWCRTAEGEDEGNMVLTTIKQGPCTVPILHNPAKIQANEQILQKVEEEAATSASAKKKPRKG
ncbi:bglB [Symbiodinium sp. CCMP2592]|nr:bglB [Symbiodinium sp. CCMP2592]CAE7402696.1 bglB [Symbiodinium sp. CCMP2592]CAE7655454.1 bglB [Symbiodinium sp. CCMP2592]